MTGLNTVLLAGICQVCHLVEEGETVDPILEHLEFLLKKSTIGVYRHNAYVGYDRWVRARADREGLNAFGDFATEELPTSFCAENLVSTKGKEGKSAKQGNAKSSKNTKFCQAYNNGSCSFRNCIFAHICQACDEPGHGKFECPRLKNKTGNK